MVNADRTCAICPAPLTKSRKESHRQFAERMTCSPACGQVYRFPPLAQRFWDKVTDAGDCWEWTGFIGTNGYGQFSVSGRLVNAHRWAWEDLRGAIPDGLVIDHLCRNRSCVNPEHLDPVTQRVNSQRGVRTSRRRAS